MARADLKGQDTMQSLPAEFNPFALMLDPQAVLARIESSERLDRLQRRICRPLDKILPGMTGADQGEGEPVTDDADAANRLDFDAWRSRR